MCLGGPFLWLDVFFFFLETISVIGCVGFFRPFLWLDVFFFESPFLWYMCFLWVPFYLIAFLYESPFVWYVFFLCYHFRYQMCSFWMIISLILCFVYESPSYLRDHFCETEFVFESLFSNSVFFKRHYFCEIKIDTCTMYSILIIIFYNM